MNYIKVKNNKGEEKEYTIIFDYTTTPDHTQYVIYTDFVRDENNIIKCYSNILDKNGNLSKVTDRKQIKFIESTLQSLADMNNIKYSIDNQ